MSKQTFALVILGVGIAILVWWFRLDHGLVAQDSKPNALAVSEGSTAAESSQPHMKGAVPQSPLDRLEVLKLHKRERPSWEMVQKLNLSDEPAVIEAFLSETNILDQRAWVWAMAAIGGSNSFKVLWGFLTNDYQGALLSSDPPGQQSDQETVLFDAATALGFVVQRCDENFPLIMTAANPSWWREKITWKSKLGSGSAHTLTSTFIKNIGLADHPQGIGLLAEVKNLNLYNRTNNDDMFNRNFAGSFSQAAFYQAEIQRVGREAVMESLLRGQIIDRWNEWAGTPDGTNWNVWYYQSLGMKPPAIRGKIVP